MSSPIPQIRINTPLASELSRGVRLTAPCIQTYYSPSHFILIPCFDISSGNLTAKSPLHGTLLKRCDFVVIPDSLLKSDKFITLIAQATDTLQSDFDQDFQKHVDQMCSSRALCSRCIIRERSQLDLASFLKGQIEALKEKPDSQNELTQLENLLTLIKTCLLARAFFRENPTTTPLINSPRKSLFQHFSPQTNPYPKTFDRATSKKTEETEKTFRPLSPPSTSPDPSSKARKTASRCNPSSRPSSCSLFFPQ